MQVVDVDTTRQPHISWLLTQSGSLAVDASFQFVDAWC